MHEHEGFIAERVTVAVAEVSLGRGADVGEDQTGCGFCGDAREVYAVPRGDCGCEDAGRGTQRGGRVVADSKTVAVVWAASVLGVGGLVRGFALGG